MLLELLAQHNGSSKMGGIELDYERDPAFFKATTPQQDRNSVMLAFVAAARAAVGSERTVGLRVPPDVTTLAEIGLPMEVLASLLRTGAVDYLTMGIGFFQFQPGASDFADLVAGIRNRTALGQILFEVTSMLRYGCAPPMQKQSFRDRLPPLALVTAAHLAYAAGADGIAAFNVTHKRPKHKSKSSSPSLAMYFQDESVSDRLLVFTVRILSIIRGAARQRARAAVQCAGVRPQSQLDSSTAPALLSLGQWRPICERPP